MSENRKFSIIIPTHNEGDWLQKTVTSVIEQTDYPDIEVIVVADGCTDNSTDFIGLNALNNVQLIELNQRTGLAQSKNIGAGVATGYYLVFIDSHMVPEAKDWLLALQEQLDKGTVGAASVRIPDYANPTAIGYLYTIKDWFLTPTWQSPVNQAEIQKAPLIPGGCFAIKREFFNQIGGFDELRNWSREDFELSLRIWRLGYDLSTSTRVGILHYFKTVENRQFAVNWDDVAYNSLRSALTLLSDEWAAKVAETFKEAHKPSYDKAMQELELDASFWQRKALLSAQFTRSFDEYVLEYEAVLPVLMC